MITTAKPSIGTDFAGVRIELHPSQAHHLDDVSRHVPGAAVSVAPNRPGYGARTYPTTVAGNSALSFFWDAGWNSIKQTLREIGVHAEWIEEPETAAA